MPIVQGFKVCHWCDEDATHRMTERYGSAHQRPWTDYACTKHAEEWNTAYYRVEPLPVRA